MNVLAIGFFATTITRITNQVHYRAESFPHAADIGFCCNTAAHLIAQLRMERGSQTDLLREAGGVFGHKAMQRFFAEQERDAKTGFFHRIALNFIGLCRCAAPQLDTAHAVTVEQFVQLFQMQLFHKTVRVIFCEIVCGMLVRLHDFFFQRHALQQVFYPLFDVLFGILIRKHDLSLSSSCLSNRNSFLIF